MDAHRHRGERRLLALCAIRIDHESVDWSLLAREVLFPGALDALWEGKVQESSTTAATSLKVLRRGVRQADELFERVHAELAAAGQFDARLVTVLDDGHPTNLRLIPNLPPFLFIRGELDEEEVRSVAVVGTRDASEAGIRRAQRMSALLAERDVTVVSGLARGIDTAAHRGAIDAGGRTIAVLGSGITKCCPAENRDLAEDITRHCALVSQYWPTRSPGRDTFPRRNVVTSGLSQGTVVIEASRTSGAKMQARLALEHGKKIFLVRSLVTDQIWATTYAQRRSAIEVGDVEEVVRHLALPDTVRRASERRQQLTLSPL